MKWATRAGCHVDRVACAWLITRFIDHAPEFIFVPDGDEMPADATLFDVPGADLSHHRSACTFETMLERYALRDDALEAIARIVHEADLADEHYDAPEAVGLDVIIRGMSLTLPDDDDLVRACRPIFDGLYAHRQSLDAASAPPG